MKKIKVQEAVGSMLAHDITEIRPGEFKGVAFRKGHKVEHEDVCHLMRLGKQHLYLLNNDEDLVHEDDAVKELAEVLAGPCVICDKDPSEGKLQLYAECDGLLTVNTEALISFNMVQDVMCASLHTRTPVKKGQKIAGTRAIPLMIDRNVLDKAVSVAKNNAPILSVKPFIPKKARLIITGSEIYNGLIQDRFKDIVERKLAFYGSTLVETSILPDDTTMISEKLRSYLAKDTDLIITTGGMSVDPDDVTRKGIREMGVHREYYGAGVLPGAMFLLAYRGELPVIGIPACALYHETTVFDVILPRLLAGELPDNRDLARLAHGGLCMDCNPCRYPSCSFAKSEF